MKRIVIILSVIVLGFFIYACSISKNSWSDIGSDRIYVEHCRDTFDHNQLDSALRTYDVHPNISEWSTMRYYSPDKEKMHQFVYTKNDTTFIVNKINAEDYVFFIRHLSNE